MERTHTEDENDIKYHSKEGEKDISTEERSFTAATDSIKTPRAPYFVVERIIQNEGPKNSRWYTVRWYVYSAADDKVEPANHITQNFIERY